MRKVKWAAAGFASLLLSPAAWAQQWGGQWSSSGGGQSWGQPAAVPRTPRVDNIGRAGQVVISVDRITGFGFHHSVDQQTRTLAAPPTLTSEYVDTYGELALFGASAGGNRPLAAGPRTPALTPRLALDYLAINGLTLGGSLMVLYDSGESGAKGSTRSDVSSSLVLVQPRVGFAYPFDSTFGIWPRVGFAWAHTSGKVTTPAGIAGGTDTEESSYDVFSLTLDAMLVYSPFKHFALLVGPYADIGLSGSGETKSSTTAANGAVTEGATTSHSIGAQSFGIAGGVAAYFP